MTSDPREYEKHWTVRALFAANRVFARAWHHVDLLTPCPLPATGPAILICNHTAGVDPFLLQSTCPRLVTWMMAKEYYDLPGLGRIARWMQYIPVKRDLRDSAALRLAIRALRDGKVLGVFPEGRIASSRRLLPFHDGVAVMAARERVPIYPAYMSGLQLNISTPASAAIPQNARIAYGAPIIGSTDNPVTGAQLRAAVEQVNRQTFADCPLQSRVRMNMKPSSGVKSSAAQKF